jgi:hypothetical protein
MFRAATGGHGKPSGALAHKVEPKVDQETRVQIQSIDQTRQENLPRKKEFGETRINGNLVQRLKWEGKIITWVQCVLERK